MAQAMTISDVLEAADVSFDGGRSIILPRVWLTKPTDKSKLDQHAAIRRGREKFMCVTPPDPSRSGDRVIALMIAAVAALEGGDSCEDGADEAGRHVVHALVRAGDQQWAWDELAEAMGIENVTIAAPVGRFPSAVESHAASRIADDLRRQFVKSGFSNLGRISSRRLAS